MCQVWYVRFGSDMHIIVGSIQIQITVGSGASLKHGQFKTRKAMSSEAGLICSDRIARSEPNQHHLTDPFTSASYPIHFSDPNRLFLSFPSFQRTKPEPIPFTSFSFLLLRLPPEPTPACHPTLHLFPLFPFIHRQVHFITKAIVKNKYSPSSTSQRLEAKEHPPAAAESSSDTYGQNILTQR